MRFKLILILFTMISCTVGKRGVFFKEMQTPPSIETHNGILVINTSNSVQNSALLIYRIDYTIDTVKKVVNIKGYQAINKEYKTRFELKVPGYSQEQLNHYTYFWIDPDNHSNPIVNRIKQ